MMDCSPLTLLRAALRRGTDGLRRRPWLALAGLIALVIVLAAWRFTRPGAAFGPQDGTWRRNQINHDLYVGLDPNYPPFAEWTPDGIIGLEADLAREIGRRLGAETQILIMGYDGLYDALYIGTVDLLISGLHADAVHDEWVHYSPPYFDAGQILVSRADRPIQTMRQLEGKRLAVEIASSGDLAARRWERRLHALAITRCLLPDEALQAVLSGEADAALVDTISARLYLKDHPGLLMAPRTSVPDGYVIAMRDENFRLAQEVEKVLADMRADGTLDQIIARWL